MPQMQANGITVEYETIGAENGEPLPTGYIQISLGHTDGSEDMDGMFQEYQAKGVKIISEPTVTPHGRREFDIEDCNGYRFCFSVDA